MTISDSEDYKFVVVLNKKIEIGIALNAASHMVAALMKKAESKDREHMKFMKYVDGDSQEHLVSGLSLIVLRADNSNKVRQARHGAIADEILYVDFTESMTGGTYVEQMKRTREITEKDLNYYGVCMFSSKEKIIKLLQNFLFGDNIR